MTDASSTQWRDIVSRPLDADPFRPLSAAATVEVAAASMCGRLRPLNTDHYLAIRLGRRGARFVSVIHPTAYVAASAQIGDGCIVAPFAAAATD